MPKREDIDSSLIDQSSLEELQMDIYVADGHIVMAFAQSITCIVMPAAQARQLGQALVEQADLMMTN